MWHHVFQHVYVKKQIRCAVSLLPPTFHRSLKCSQRTSVQASRRCSTHYAHGWMQVLHTQVEERRRQRRWRRNLRRLHDHNCWNLSQTLCAWCQTELFIQRQSKQCHYSTAQTWFTSWWYVEANNFVHSQWKGCDCGRVCSPGAV